MELSDEQKERILDEERTRAAEETYRAEVRRGLDRQVQGNAPDRQSRLGSKAAIFGIATAVILAVLAGVATATVRHIAGR
jgi:hypothetical protein